MVDNRLLLRCTVRNARHEEYAAIGALMVAVYSRLDGFPQPAEQPDYYAMLARVGNMTEQPGVELLVAADQAGTVLGTVVYIGDMRYYGSGGTATREQDAAGFRLLAVDPAYQGQGIGTSLIHACIAKARDQRRRTLIIHSTKAMTIAWRQYEKLGFARAEDLDFMQQSLPVFGFRLPL